MSPLDDIAISLESDKPDQPAESAKAESATRRDFSLKFRSVFLAEFLGTALFVFIGTGSVFASNAAGPAGGIVGIALAFGFAISVLVRLTSI